MTTFEPQYAWQVELRDRLGDFRMGLTSGSTYYSDPRRLGFLLARYKFAAKLIAGKSSVLEIGCGDGFGSRLLMQEVPDYCGVDIDPVFIGDARARAWEPYHPKFTVHNILEETLSDVVFSSAVSLDVLEHIQAEFEHKYFENIIAALSDSAVFICGMPSLESQIYASSGGEGHVNCKSGPDFKELCARYFENVFLFSMNDELVHTGFVNMAHYLIGVCVAPRR